MLVLRTITSLPFPFPGGDGASGKAIDIFHGVPAGVAERTHRPGAGDLGGGSVIHRGQSGWVGRAQEDGQGERRMGGRQ